MVLAHGGRHPARIDLKEVSRGYAFSNVNDFPEGKRVSSDRLIYTPHMRDSTKSFIR